MKRHSARKKSEIHQANCLGYGKLSGYDLSLIEIIIATIDHVTHSISDPHCVSRLDVMANCLEAVVSSVFQRSQPKTSGCYGVANPYQCYELAINDIVLMEDIAVELMIVAYVISDTVLFIRLEEISNKLDAIACTSRGTYFSVT